MNCINHVTYIQMQFAEKMSCEGDAKCPQLLPSSGFSFTLQRKITPDKQSFFFCCLHPLPSCQLIPLLDPLTIDLEGLIKYHIYAEAQYMA